jgi:hypothetical protein
VTSRGVSTLRNWAGRAGALFAVFFLVFLLDALFAQLREPAASLSCTAGQVIRVTGPLPEKTSLEDLTFRTGSKDLRLAFDSPNRDYWLGARGWRGRILVDRAARPGTYEIYAKAPPSREGGFERAFRVTVFQDRKALRQASASYARRFLDVSPWVGMVVLFPLVVLSFGGVFLLSDKAGRLLRREGRSEVYRVSKAARGYLIYFDMGCDQGVRPGDSLTLLSAESAPTGKALVLEAYKDYSIAESLPEIPVRPGWLVSRFD